DHAKKLERITFHEKLGTVADKVERVAKLAKWLVEEGIIKPSPLQGSGLGEGESRDLASDPLSPTLSPEGERETRANLAQQAARLCKADLVTEMVGEFPDLQGLRGGYYARAEGLPAEVADAIRDHYKPVGQGDLVPTAPVTVAVSLADKLDTLVGFYALAGTGWRPTGSKDPFALRRATIGIIRTAERLRLSLPLEKALAKAFAGHVVTPRPALSYLNEQIVAQLTFNDGLTVPYLVREIEHFGDGKRQTRWIFDEFDIQKAATTANDHAVVFAEANVPLGELLDEGAYYLDGLNS